jgi:hypothetical protein
VETALTMQKAVDIGSYRQYIWYNQSIVCRKGYVNMPNFQRFDRNAAPPPGKPFLTIQKSGSQMSLNSSAYEQLGSPEAVDLNFDPDEQLIGLHPCDPKEPWGYGVYQMGNSNTWTVSTRAFTLKWGINTDRAMRYSAKFEDGYLVIDLKQGGSDVTSPRSQHK